MNKLRLIKPIEYALLLVHLIIGLCVVNDYGISWDEPLQRNHGLVSMDYINEVSGYQLFDKRFSEDTWAGYPYKDHGVIFQLTCLSIEKGFGISDYRSKFMIRHVIGFLIFSIGAFAFYFLLRKRWGYRWAMVGFLFLILSPRIFAHSFYNPKDTVALGWYCLCLFTGVRFLDNSSWSNAVLHAVATALLVNSRLFGVYILFTTCGLYMVNQVLNANWTLKKWKWLPYTSYVILTILFIHLIWPNMWEDPFNNLYYGLRRVSKYHWLGEILFFGHWVPAQNIPWYYLPVWIGITTPILYVISFIVGLLLWSIKSIRELITAQTSKINAQDLAIVVFALGPIAAVVIKESVMYDGWRHMYFVYGGLIYFAIYALKSLHERISRSRIKWAKRVVPMLVAANSLWIIGVMFDAHPHQNAYYNRLIEQPSISNFEADYWGTSFKQLLEQLHEKYPDKALTLYSRSEPLYFNYLASNEDIKAHIEVIPHDEFPPEKDYVYCSIFRGKYDQYLYSEHRQLFEKPLHEIKLGKNLVCGAYQF